MAGDVIGAVQSLLGGGSGGQSPGGPDGGGGMANYGALGGGGGSQGNVLATLRSAGSGAANQASPGSAYSPTQAAIGGGMAAVDPHGSAGGAFMQGFAGAMKARQEALLAQQHYGLEAAKANSEIQYRALEMEQMRLKQRANAGLIGGDPGGQPDGSPEANPVPGGGGPAPAGAPPGAPMPLAGAAPPGGPSPGGPPAGPPATPADPKTPGVGPPTVLNGPDQPAKGDPGPPSGGPGPAGPPPGAPQGGPGPLPTPGGPAGAPPAATGLALNNGAPSAPPPIGGPPPQAAPAPQAAAPPPIPQGTGEELPASIRGDAPNLVKEGPDLWKLAGPRQNVPQLLINADKARARIAQYPGADENIIKNLETRAQQQQQMAEDVQKNGILLGGKRYLIQNTLDNANTVTTRAADAAARDKSLQGGLYDPRPGPDGRMMNPPPGGWQDGGQPAATGPGPGNVPPTPQQRTAALNGAQPPQQDLAQPATPPKAQINSKTGQIQSYQPPAPPGGGYSMQPTGPGGGRYTAPNATTQAQVDNDKEMLKGMAGESATTENAIQNLTTLGHQFQTFKSGPGTERQAHLAQTLSKWGMNGLGSAVMGGEDPNSPSVVAKLGVGATFNTIKQNLTNGSRINLAEFKITNSTAVPTADASPEANHENIAETLGAALYKRQFAQDWQQAQQQGWQSPTAYYEAWKQGNTPATYVEAARRQIGNFQGQAMPHPDKMMPGAAYVYNPDGQSDDMQKYMQGKGIAPGVRFRFNGPDAQQSITKLGNGQGE